MASKLNPLSVTAKKAAGYAAADLIKDGMIVGLGTGATASFFIEALSKRCQGGLNITAVASSVPSMLQAQKGGIPLVSDQTISYLDVTVDGADEIDRNKNMIKGGGGALLREKLLAYSSKEMIVIVDENKLVDHLGNFPVPIEISPFAYQTTVLRLSDLGYKGSIRLNDDRTFHQTENGHYIYDIQFERPILDPHKENEKLIRTVGVLETGLFCGIAGRVVVGFHDGLVKIR